MFIFLSAYAEEDPLIQKSIRRSQAHLSIKDYVSARDEAKSGLALYPHSASMHEAYIRCLARCGDEREMLFAWKCYCEKFPDQSENRRLIEEMAWGVLDKASSSSSLIMRQLALLAAFFCQETKGVDILHQGMQDRNYAIRAFAVKMASHLHDKKLRLAVKKCFKKERMVLVRSEAIKAIGQMKMTELQPDLEALISSDDSSAEEKSLAIASLLDLIDSVKREDVVRLASSNRSGLRLLACQAIGFFHSTRDFDQLVHLVKDSQAEVRAAAFQTIGLVRPMQEEEVLAIAQKGVQDAHFKVALSAAWLLTLYRSEEGCRVFERFLKNEKQEIRLFAAAALAATGRYGMGLSLCLFEVHFDPYVRLNLALGLIGQRAATAKAAKVIKQMMMNEKEKWCEKEWGLFSCISNLRFQKNVDEISSPEMDNQLIRLKLFNILASLKEEGTQEAIRQFLAERNWGISGTAAALLLTEGDEEAIDLVKDLLNDSHPKVRIQAALVLSLWSREESAIHVLEEGYAGVDKELKAKILEGLGRIGTMTSVPFLIKVLEEPSQTLRLIAAMALIQCLNN